MILGGEVESKPTAELVEAYVRRVPGVVGVECAGAVVDRVDQRAFLFQRGLNGSSGLPTLRLAALTSDVPSRTYQAMRWWGRGAT